MPEMTTPNRRSFLKATAAVGAAAVYVPSTVRGANDKVTVGVIGVGGRGTSLLRELVRLHDEQGIVEIAGVCDVYGRRVSRAVEISGAQGYDNYRDLLARPEIDGVVIATPDHWHAKMSIDACKAEKDVYVEKPMTRTLKEAKKVWETVEKTRRVMQVGSQHASNDRWLKASQALHSGVVGKLIMTVGTYSRNSIEGEWNYQIDPEAGPDKTGDDHIDWKEWLGDAKKISYNPEHFFRFRKYWNYSGGIATDLHYHRLTMMTVAWGGGEFPWRVSGTGGIRAFPDREVPDTFSMTADYYSGHHVNIFSTMANAMNNFPDVVQLRGHQGTIDGYTVTPEGLFADDFRDRCEAAGLTGEWGETTIPQGRREKVIQTLTLHEEERPTHMENFLHCIKSRAKPNLDAFTGLQIMAAIDMSVESYRKGRTMYFDQRKISMRDKPNKRPMV